MISLWMGLQITMITRDLKIDVYGKPLTANGKLQIVF